MIWFDSEYFSGNMCQIMLYSWVIFQISFRYRLAVLHLVVNQSISIQFEHIVRSSIQIFIHRLCFCIVWWKKIVDLLPVDRQCTNEFSKEIVHYFFSKTISYDDWTKIKHREQIFSIMWVFIRFLRRLRSVVIFL